MDRLLFCSQAVPVVVSLQLFVELYFELNGENQYGLKIPFLEKCNLYLSHDISIVHCISS